jgi:hypothetical protein
MVPYKQAKGKAKKAQRPSLHKSLVKERLKKDWKDLRIPCKHGLKIDVVKFPAAAAARQTGNTTVPAITHDPLAPTVEEVFNSLDFLF